MTAPLFNDLRERVVAAVLTGEQAAFIEELNPCFRERHVESDAPGELFSTDTFFVGNLKGIGKVYLHAVVDTYGSYAFGFLHVSKQPEVAVAVLHNDVLPFYRNLDLPVKAVLTDNGREFCGTDTHPYELYLELNGIEHRCTRVKTPRPTDLSSDSMERSSMNSFASKYAKRSTKVWRRYRHTSTVGSSTATRNGRTIRFLEQMQCAILSSHRILPPRGIDGGGDGEVGRTEIRRGDGSVEVLKACDQTEVDAGEAVVLTTPTSGGYGEG